jgi:hypothetical protein
VVFRANPRDCCRDLATLTSGRLTRLHVDRRPRSNNHVVIRASALSYLTRPRQKAASCGHHGVPSSRGWSSRGAGECSSSRLQSVPRPSRNAQALGDIVS